jgi:hypothetical protein
MLDQYSGRQGYQRDRCEIFERVVLEVLVQTIGDDDVAERPHDQRVTVRRRARHQFGADRAGSARPVVDNDLLAPGFAHFLTQQARQDIGVAARCVGHHEADGFCGVRLPGSGPGEGER